MKRFLIGATVIGILAAAALGIAMSQLPAIGAGALLFPSRHITTRKTPDGCVDRKFNGDGVILDGWECKTSSAARRGTIVYLHGVADNRGSAVGVIDRFRPLGFDVIAYDSRGHGTSGGDRCTYGFFEKRDVQRVLDQLQITDAILIGHSLGAAVALQTAAIEPRVRAVVSVSTFSDLRTISTERATFLPSWSLGPAFARAEHDGNFIVDDVSPVKAAAKITVPVLIIHGAQDRDTIPSHSLRVYEALRQPKQMVLLQGAMHNDAMNGQALARIEGWLSESVAWK